MALFCLTVAEPSWAAGTPVEQATAEQKREAQQKYLAAKRAFDKKDFEEALVGFRESYGVVASPNSHHMIVRTLDALGRAVEAYTEAETTVAEAEAAAAKDNKYQRTAVAARTKRDELRGKIGLLTVTVANAEEGATLSVAGEPLDPAQWGTARPVAPGTITIELSGSAGTTTREVQVPAGGDVKAEIGPEAEEDGDGDEPEPAPTGDDGSPGLRIASYIVGGVGLVGWGMFAIAGSIHLSKYSDLEDRCYAGFCPAGTQADIDRGKDAQIAANIGVGIGAVGLTAAVIMFIASQPDVRFEAKGSSTTPSVAIGPGVVTVKGRF